MTSAERREARYQRRKAARVAKRRRYLDQYDNFDPCVSPSALIASHLESRRGVLWKCSPAMFDARYIKYACRLSKKLRAGLDITQNFYHTIVIERGKTRDVHSVHYSERVVRHSVCKNSLVPLLSRSLIYDNGACLKNKGCSFTASRVERMLHWWYRHHGTEGYAVVVDFKSYFASIPHDKLLVNLSRYVHDPRLFALIRQFVQSPDVHHVSDTPGRGLFIGPEDSQILAISYPNYIDHYIKDYLGIKCYARYNDDSIILVKDKQQARVLLSNLCRMYDAFGIVPNRKKTQIVKLSKGFNFLKIHYQLTDTGKLLRLPVRQSVVRQRRKMRRQHRLYQTRQMTLHQVCQSYMSWRGHMRDHKDAAGAIRRMDAAFKRYFGATPWKKSRKGIAKCLDTNCYLLL